MVFLWENALKFDALWQNDDPVDSNPDLHHVQKPYGNVPELAFCDDTRAHFVQQDGVLMDGVCAERGNLASRPHRHNFHLARSFKLHFYITYDVGDDGEKPRV